MKLILLMMMTTSFLFSSYLSKLYKLYEQQAYDKACNYGLKYYSKNKKDEKYLTLYGLSCLETNNLSRIAIPMIHLTKTADARANASYFGTILLQKQLLLQALMDKKEIFDLSLPQTNFVLSKIFSLFMEKKYIFKNNIYSFEESDNTDLSYKLYIKKNKKNRTYMIIDIYKNEKFSKRYQYE
jgi:hypothetical protein